MRAATNAQLRSGPLLWCALLTLPFAGMLAGPRTEPAAASAMQVVASAGASVSPARAHTNPAAARRLRVGGRARWRTLLRFDVPRDARPISHATLRLRISGRAGAGLIARRITSRRRWRDGASRQARRLPVAGVVGRWTPSTEGGGSCGRRTCSSARLISIDVSAAVTADGSVSLAIVGARGASVAVSRRRAPALILQRVASPPTAEAPLADAEAADRIRRSAFEPRPGNATANRRTPTAEELVSYRRETQDWRRCNGYPKHVTGGFTGTTDEILQWAAAKWGLDADLLRAAAAVESWWDQGVVGNGESFGLLQVKRSSFPAAGDLPRVSTPFSADLYGATIRSYHDGCATWLNTVPRGREYAPGDVWGSVGAWYAGRWHTDDAEWYIGRVMKTRSARVWESPDF